MPYVDNSQITPLYANTTPGVVADANVIDPAIAALIVAINTNYDLFTNFIGAMELPIPDQSIVTRHLRNLAVTNPKLAPLAVTADKIADGTITTQKLVDMVITAQKIANGTITEPKYANGSVSSRVIADSSVMARHFDPSLFLPYTDISIQAEFEKRGVNVQKYGAKGDGFTDDTLAINTALSSGNPIFFPDGVYLVYSQILWDGKNVVFGVGYPVLKAMSPMESVVKCDKDNNNITVNGAFRTGIWTNINIDGNFMATDGFYIKKGKGLNIGNFSVMNAVNALLVLGDTTPSSVERVFECNVHDIYLPGGNGAARSNYCIYGNATFVDSDIQNIVMNNAKINHINHSGTNDRWFNIHPYSYPLDQQIDTMWEAKGQGNQHDQLYIDSPGRRGIHITGSIQRFSGVQFLCPDFIDAVSNKQLIHIDKTTATQFDQIVTNIATALNPSKRSLIRTIEIDNSTNVIFDASIQSMSHVGSVPNEDLLIIGKVPNRLSHSSFLSSSTNPYYVGQEYFTIDIYNGDTFRNFTFKNEMQNNVYTINVETFFNSTWWVSNKTTTGFRVNFGTTPPTGGFIFVRVIPRG